MIQLNFASIIDLTLLAGFYLFYLYPRYSQLDKKEYWIRTIFYLYICFVLLVTLMPITTSLPHLLNHQDVIVHLKPFEDLKLGYLDADKQVILNILLTIPFGYLVPQISRLENWKIFVIGTLLSISIEWIQPYLNSTRSCDITDVITNASGVLIGLIIYKLFHKIYKHFA